MTSALKLGTVSTRQQRIATLAQQSPTMSFTSLAYFIDRQWLREAYHRTRKDGAEGVDGRTVQEYSENLEVHLRNLLNRAKSGTYRAPPVRRVHIPKGDGRTTRPIGIPTFEDKVLQRAVAMVLEPLYEQDFLDCSYGFRPGRSPHRALQSFREQMMQMKGGWVLEVLPKRFARYGLKLHPTKTRLVSFRRPRYQEPPPGSPPPPRPHSFDLLGLRHYWGRSRKGYWVIKRKTASRRFSRAVRVISQWCRRHRHEKIRDQQHMLRQKLLGHYAYYGITGNYVSLHRFYETVKQLWKKWLSRRSQRGYLDWEKFGRLLRHYPLPRPKVVHSTYRFVANP